MSTRKTFYIIEKKSLSRIRQAAQILRPDGLNQLPVGSDIRAARDLLEQVIKEITRDTANEFARKLRKEM
ncbi:hypothetical protein LCGC14_0483670 [marine sediment metagenome]|uniref:Uncharacterized protein n=1 Tax=marine sediment metagenome TaxID=412755 RepID=A0A0F9UVK4_9ZZZZ